MPKVTKDKCSFDGCGPACPLVRFFPDANYVKPKMGTSLRLVVAEAPGQEEDERGEPLVGGSGRLFDSLARQAGLKRDELTLTNTLSIRPPNNVFPTDAVARSYISEEDARLVVEHSIQHHLMPLVESRPWNRIDALGDKALVALTGKTGGIMMWRGSPLPLIGETEIRVVPTLHPAYIMRDQSMIPVFVNDLKKSAICPPEYYNVTPTLADVQAFAATEFAFDLEVKWGTNEITMIGLCAKPFHVLVVPFLKPYINELKRIFKNAKVLYAHNGLQFDIPILFPALDLEWKPQ